MSFELDFDFPFIDAVEFSPSHSSDTDTIFSSPSHTPTFELNFNHFYNEENQLNPYQWPSVTPLMIPPVAKSEVLPFDFNIPHTTSPVLPPVMLPPAPEVPRTKRRKVDATKELASLSPLVLEDRIDIPNSLTLTRDELLTFSSDQYENLIDQVRKNRDLTATEKRDIKRQRRLIKNRESAHASRQRKKNYVEELEKKISELTDANATLIQQLGSVQTENIRLRTENEYLKSGTVTSAIQRGISFISGQGSQLFPHPPSMSTSLPQVMHQQQSKAFVMPPQRTPPPVKTNGVILMVLLFSFGIMLGNVGFPTYPRMSDSDPITPTRVFELEEFQPLANPNDVSAFVGDIPSRDFQQRWNAEVPQPPRRETANVAPAVSKSAVVPPVVEELKVLSTLPLDPSFWKANTTYLKCDTIRQIFPPEHLKLEPEPNAPPQISFVIPPSELDPSSFLAVTCNVVDVSVLPFVESGSS